MIDAYYSLGSDSEKLFEDTKIAQNPDYKKYMNRYNVIHLDISTFGILTRKILLKKSWNTFIRILSKSLEMS